MLRSRRLIFICIVLFIWPLSSLAQQLSDAEIEQRVNALLQQMMLEEKAGQITQLPGMNSENVEAVKQGKAGSLLGVVGAEDANKSPQGTRTEAVATPEDSAAQDA